MKTPPKSFDAVIFDNDGTLVDSEAITLSVLMDMAVDHGAVLEPDDNERFVGAHLQLVFDEIARRAGKPVPDDFLDIFRAEQISRISNGLAEIPGATETLEYFDAHDIPVAVASNAPLAKMALCLDSTELARFFPESHRFSAYDIGVWKPAPDIFLHAARSLGVDPQRCAVVEDSPTGVEAALASGSTVFAFDPGGRFADRSEVTSLGRLSELIDIIEHR